MMHIVSTMYQKYIFFSYTYDIMIKVEKNETTNSLLRIGIGKTISKPMRFYLPGTVFALNKIKKQKEVLFYEEKYFLRTRPSFRL